MTCLYVDVVLGGSGEDACIVAGADFPKGTMSAALTKEEAASLLKNAEKVCEVNGFD